MNLQREPQNKFGDSSITQQRNKNFYEYSINQELSFMFIRSILIYHLEQYRLGGPTKTCRKCTGNLWEAKKSRTNDGSAQL